MLQQQQRISRWMLVDAEFRPIIEALVIHEDTARDTDAAAILLLYGTLGPCSHYLVRCRTDAGKK